MSVPRLRGGEPIELPGYPMHMVHAERILTAVQRGTANTRWRDFGDIWSLSRQHPIAADDLVNAIDEVARHRGATIRPLAETLGGLPISRRQAGRDGGDAATQTTCLSSRAGAPGRVRLRRPGADRRRGGASVGARGRRLGVAAAAPYIDSAGPGPLGRRA